MTLAYGLLILAQLMVAINIVGSKFLISTTPILFLITCRFLLATIFLLPIHWLTKNRRTSLAQHFKKINKKDWLLIIVQAICAGTLFNFFMVLGLRYTDAQTAGIITSTLPALILIACWLVLKEPLTLKKCICIGFATLGLCVISIHKSVSNTHAYWLGSLLVLIALLPESTYYVLTKFQGNRLPVFLMSATINAINAAILIPIMLWQVNWQSLHFSEFQLMILIMISLASGLFYVFWYLGADKVDSALASLATAIMPIATIIIAWLALGETITGYDLAGMGLVILSIIAYAYRVKS